MSVPANHDDVHALGEATSRTLVEIVLPVFNEAHVLASSVKRLQSYLEDEFPFTWRITIVDNASTDETLAVAEQVAADLGGIRVLHLDRKGRGFALRTAWTRSDAAVVAYMDIDLSTRLDALLPLVAPLVSGHSDLAVGSRLATASNVARGPKREFISRGYNFILRGVFGSRVRDAQCGFKAVRSNVARALVPAVEDTEWFFDTELLLLAEFNGLRILEIPVDWSDDPDSRVHIVPTAVADLRGVARMARRFAAGGGTLDLGTQDRLPFENDFGRHLVSLGGICAATCAASVSVFLVVRKMMGPAAGGVAAVTAATLGTSRARRRCSTSRRPSRSGVL